MPSRYAVTILIPQSQTANINFVCNVTQASLSREGDRVSGGRSFLGIELLNFILHAYSFSLTFVRQLPRGGSLSLNPTFQL